MPCCSGDSRPHHGLISSGRGATSVANRQSTHAVTFTCGQNDRPPAHDSLPSRLRLFTCRSGSIVKAVRGSRKLTVALVGRPARWIHSEVPVLRRARGSLHSCREGSAPGARADDRAVRTRSPGPAS